MRKQFYICDVFACNHKFFAKRPHSCFKPKASKPAGFGGFYVFGFGFDLDLLDFLIYFDFDLGLLGFFILFYFGLDLGL
jgi:hypothetical protein